MINTPKGGVSAWLHIWNELSQSAGKQLGYQNLIGNTPRLTQPQTNVTVAGDILYIPLEFWFNRNAGLNRVGPKNESIQDLLVRESHIRHASDKTKLRETLYTKNTYHVVKILGLDNPQPKLRILSEAQRLNSFGGVT